MAPPRRLLLLVLLSAVTTSVILFTIVKPPELPLPTYMSLRGQDWIEYGGDGRCVSPFHAHLDLSRWTELADTHPSVL